MKPWTLRPADDFHLSLRQRLTSLRRETGFVATLCRAAWWGLVRTLSTGVSPSRSARARKPAQIRPFVLVANHASHIDALTLSAGLPMSLCDRTSALAAGDTFFTHLSISVFAALALNALPIWRRQTKRDYLTQLRERLAERSCVYLIFPEGTRSRDGSMAQFKPGLGALVAGTEIPVVPCHIAGAHRAWPPSAKFPRPRKIMLRIGQPITFAGVENDPDGWRDIAARAESAVRALAPAQP